MSNNANHPYIGFIVGRMNELLDLLTPGSYSAGLDVMEKVLHSVEPNAQKKVNWQNLERDLNDVMGKRHHRIKYDVDEMIAIEKLRRFDEENARLYMNFYHRLWYIMWDNQYLYEGTYRPERRSSSLRVDQ